MHLGNLLQSEGGVAVAGPVQIVPVQRGVAAQPPGPSAPPAASRPTRGPAAAAAAAAVLGLGGVTSRGHVAAAAAAAAAGTEASRAARRAAAAAAGSRRAPALGWRGRCWPPAVRAGDPVDRPAAVAAAAAAAAAHTAGAAAAAAAAAAGESDPAPSIATLREGPEVSAAAAAHIQFSGGREPARGASLSFGRSRGAPRDPQLPLPAPRPASRPLHCRKRQQIPAAPAGLAGSLGASRVVRAAAEGKRRATAAGSVGAQWVSALPGRGSRRRRSSRGGCCWRWRLLKLLLGLLGLWLLGSRWLFGPGLCFLVLLADPLDHSAPVQRASLAPGTWGLRSVCVQRAAAAAAP